MPRAAALLAAGLLGVAFAGCAAAPVTKGAAAADAPPGLVRGRLVYRDHAVPGSVLTAVSNPGGAFQEERISAAAGPDGWVALPLSPGIWYLLARAGDPEIFGWFGSNPVQVRPGETVEITIPGVASGQPHRTSAVPAGEEAVAGEVIGEEGPVPFAAVTFYLDAATQFRGPGYLEAQTDEAGRFEARISAGRYYLVVRRRAGSAAFGPLEAGDAFGFYAGNPLAVRSGERVSLRLGAVRVLKKSGWSAPSVLRTRVSGTIRDTAGRPLEGYRAFLHAQPSMLGKPEFVSELSGADGTFTIWVDREGRYYLGARVEIGRAREEREIIGLYTGSPDHAVTVALGAGELRLLEITVETGERRP